MGERRRVDLIAQGLHISDKIRRERRLSRETLLVLAVALIFLAWRALSAQQGSEEFQDITGTYQFLTADDKLSILEQEGKLNGDLDIYQGEEESDAVLSYEIISGSRKKDRVEFKTNKIHQKYYRFSGTVQRGSGLEEKDPDYLRLVGDVEIITTQSGSGEEAVQRMHVVLKSRGKAESEEK
jgi:hypothetical protein